METSSFPLELGSLSFIVTEACNYDCIYCPQKKKNRFMSLSIIEKAIDFFYPFLRTPQKSVQKKSVQQKQGFEILSSKKAPVRSVVQGGVGRRPILKKEKCNIIFYGGEPLLGLDRIKHIIFYIGEKNKNQEKDISFSMTTNGSLLDDECIKFLDHHKFNLMLSFDGLAHEIGRKKQSLDDMIELIKNIRHYPGIELTTNSVFIPDTVEYLSQSLQLIIKLGIQEPKFELSIINEWNDTALLKLNEQLSDLKDFLVSYFKKTGTVPLSEFREKENNKKSMFGCAGAKDRLAIAPDGELWGCYLFPDFFKDKTDTKEYQKFFLGHLEDFIENYESILEEKLPHYQDLYQGSFYTDETFCFACQEVEDCKVCPVSAALSDSILLGKIPKWVCKINKLKKAIQKEFAHGVGTLFVEP